MTQLSAQPEDINNYIILHGDDDGDDDDDDYSLDGDEPLLSGSSPSRE